MNAPWAAATARLEIALSVPLVAKAALLGAATVVALVATADPVVHEPAPPAFRIDSVTQLNLAPDTTVPVELRLTNHGRAGLTVTKLTARVGGITTPPGQLGCTAGDFEVRQFSGRYGFVVGPERTSSLSELGIARGQWPQLTMVNRAVNQDACKNAAITLHLTGQAAEVTS